MSPLVVACLLLLLLPLLLPGAQALCPGSLAATSNGAYEIAYTNVLQSAQCGTTPTGQCSFGVTLVRPVSCVSLVDMQFYRMAVEPQGVGEISCYAVGATQTSPGVYNLSW